MISVARVDVPTVVAFSSRLTHRSDICPDSEIETTPLALNRAFTSHTEYN